MNPYLQYFLGLDEYRYECPFDPSMMTKFRQRITPEMLGWVNDQIIDRKAEQDNCDDDDSSGTESEDDENKGGKSIEEENEGTIILDATCAPQNIRFPTDAYNDSTTLQQSVEAYRKAYGHYPARVLADTIFRTRKNLKYCKNHGIHLNGPKLGKPFADPAEAKKHRKLEWLESGERGKIEQNFGVGKRCYSLDCIVTKLKETSEVMIHSIVVFMNLRKKLRLLLCFFSTGSEWRFTTGWKMLISHLPGK